MRVFFAVIYAVVTISFDHYIFHEQLHIADTEMSLFSGIYSWLAEKTNRATVVKETVLLELGDGDDEPKIADDICLYRGHVAKALDKAANLNPAVVIVDIQFATNTKCPQDQDLREKATLVRNKGIPLFFGRTLVNGEPSPAIRPECDETCREPAALLETAAVGGLGLLELPPDERKFVLAYENSSGEGVRALAWAAAANVDQRLEERISRRDAHFTNELYHPVLKPSQWRSNKEFFHWDKFQALVDSPAVGHHWLIIGSSEDEPVEDEVSKEEGARQKGFYHHASVLEAILQETFWVPLPDWSQFVAACVFWFLLEFWESKWMKVLAALLCLLVVFVINFALMALKIGYGDFALISSIGLLITLLEWFAEWRHERREHWIGKD